MQVVYNIDMNRTPPTDVRRQLRKEVGFVCPVTDCENPYLEYHHFDPPWSERQHHEPSGMIALCAEHHAKADSGAFTNKQLHRYKREVVSHNRIVEGRFDWLRHNLLAVVGEFIYWETDINLIYKGNPVIWFKRDEDGHLLLNVKMLTTSDEPRTIIEDNDWLSSGNPEDIVCPPSGRLLEVKYANGDRLRIEFKELKSETEAKKRYSNMNLHERGISFPITVVEVQNAIAGAGICFERPETTLPGGNIFKNIFISDCSSGIEIS